MIECALYEACDAGVNLSLGLAPARRDGDRYGIDDLVCSKVRPPGTATTKKLVPLGLRWPIERTNGWPSNFGQLRRNTDRRIIHRLAQLALAIAIALLLTAKLIDWRNR